MLKEVDSRLLNGPVVLMVGYELKRIREEKMRDIAELALVMIMMMMMRVLNDRKV